MNALFYRTRVFVRTAAGLQCVAFIGFVAGGSNNEGIYKCLLPNGEERRFSTLYDANGSETHNSTLEG
jgi:hypothetical protein